MTIISACYAKSSYSKLNLITKDYVVLISVDVVVCPRDSFLDVLLISKKRHFLANVEQVLKL